MLIYASFITMSYMIYPTLYILPGLIWNVYNPTLKI